MKKGRFVEIAPAYYALAICTYFRKRAGDITQSELQQYFSVPPREDHDGYEYLQNDLIFIRGIAWLLERGMIEALLDDFGPPTYREAPGLDERWRELSEDPNLPFHKYARLSEPRNWLYDALVAVNRAFDELGIVEADFETQDEEWQPLPLDRDDERLQNLIKTLDDTIEQVRGDNGYASAVPEERNYVLTTLAHASHTLKRAATTSIPYIRKFAFEPLMTLMRRFKDAAIGIAATGAREALIEFVRQHAARLLDYLKW